MFLKQALRDIDPGAARIAIVADTSAAISGSVSPEESQRKMDEYEGLKTLQRLALLQLMQAGVEGRELKTASTAMGMVLSALVKLGETEDMGYQVPGLDDEA